MSKSVLADGCGCFPTGRHYAGIAHLLRTAIRGLADEFSSDAPWNEIPIAFIDVETTGRDASVDRIVEIGIVVGRASETIARHNWLVHPGCPIPEEAKAVHGISDDDVKDAPRFEAVASKVVEALAGCIAGAYNAPFDRAFVYNEFARAGIRSQDATGAVTPPAMRKEVDWIDPLIWARDLHREERSRTLGDMAVRLGVPLETAHRASDDAEAALHVLYRLGSDARVPRTYGAFIREQKRLAQLQTDERRRWRS